MNQYVNAFHLAQSNSGDEIILYFAQNHPTFSEVGKIESVDQTAVASLVMSRNAAEHFLESLDKILHTKVDEDDISTAKIPD